MNAHELHIIYICVICLTIFICRSLIISLIVIIGGVVGGFFFLVMKYSVSFFKKAKTWIKDIIQYKK